MTRRHLYRSIAALLLMFCLGACSTGKHPAAGAEPARRPEPGKVIRSVALEPALEAKILALDPERVTDEDIRSVLAHAPAPHIMNIHGGVYPVHLAMESFSHFLIKMGYPKEAVKSPADGAYSYSCYDSSEKLAGILAWHYEQEGMRPMIVGHSQGGMQAVKILYELSGKFGSSLNVWNPTTDSEENRQTITDPLNGQERPVTGLQLSYVSAVGSGGLTRLLPNQWSMFGKLRSIPDSVEEFTGFSIGIDFWGGDLFGLSSTNSYHANGRALVRNVKLPTSYNHVIIPVTTHLAKNREMREWINAYKPSEEPRLDREFDGDSKNILWAADVWHSIKKHWVIELKKLIEAKRNLPHGSTKP